MGVKELRNAGVPPAGTSVMHEDARSDDSLPRDPEKVEARVL